MEKKKKNLIEEIEQTLDKKLTVAEMYANRPRKWVLYLAIVLLIVVMVGWSASDIKFTGLTVTGTEVAKGVLHGVFSRIKLCFSAHRIRTFRIFCCKPSPLRCSARL